MDLKTVENPKGLVHSKNYNNNKMHIDQVMLKSAKAKYQINNKF